MKYVMLAFALTFTACNYNKVKSKEGGSGALGAENIAQPDFKAVQSVLGAKCASCHSNMGGNQGGTNLETYQAVRSKLNRVLYRSLETRDMPPRQPLTEREMTLLRNWADSGAPETVIGIGEKPGDNIESGPTNWAKIKDKLFAAKCNTCHQQPKPDAGLDLTDLAQVRGRAPAIFDRVIVKQDMPISPYPAVTPRERRVLLKWFDAGMPE